MHFLTVKTGDTLTFSCMRKSSSGTPVSLENVTVRSQMVRLDQRVDLTTEIVNESEGTFRVTLPATETANLVVGNYISDIEFVDSANQVISTETFSVKMVRDITDGDS